MGLSGGAATSTMHEFYLVKAQRPYYEGDLILRALHVPKAEVKWLSKHHLRIDIEGTGCRVWDFDSELGRTGESDTVYVDLQVRS